MYMFVCVYSRQLVLLCSIVVEAFIFYAK